MAQRFESVEEYVASYPPEVQERLRAVLDVVRATAPEATEQIAYGMPTFKVGGRALMHVAAWTSYLSVYPTPAGDEAFQRDLAPYRATRSTARFPFDAELPLDLLARMVALLRLERAPG
ncbi:MAG: iron chaperone [Nocardioides sp.]